MSYSDYSEQIPMQMSEQKRQEGMALAFANLYKWMFFGMLVTAGAAFSVISFAPLRNLILGNQMVYMAVAFAPLALVLYIGARMNKMSSGQALNWFFIYSAVTGLGLAPIFLIYTGGSIVSAFALTGGLFGLMSFAGFVLKRDLSKFGPILFFGIIGIVIASVVNFFLQNSMLDMIITWIGIPLFLALTVWKTQNTKQQLERAIPTGNQELVNKISIMGALTLYISFINLFWFILKVIGNRR